MKARLIKLTLANKFNDYLTSIDDEKVRDLIRHNTIITGGSIVSMLLNERVHDFDMYFRTADVAEAAAEYYMNKFKANPPVAFKGTDGQSTVALRVERTPDRVKLVIKSAGIAGETGSNDYQYFEQVEDGAQENFVQDAVANLEAADEEPDTKLDDKGCKGGVKYRPIFISSNAITLANRVQIIIRFYGEPAEIHENYDFMHCCNYWTSWDNTLVLKPEALEAIITRDLRYVGSKYPICSLIRSRKFIKRGWNINAGQYLKMAWQISGLDLADINVLEEQLVGVDAAYFRQLIDLLQKKDPAKVDGAYLMSIIDKVF